MRPTATTRRLAPCLALAAMVAPTTLADDGARTPPAIAPAPALSAAELAGLLGAEVWKFRVALPPGATRFRAGLSAREKGKDGRAVGPGLSGPIDPASARDVLIAIIPVDGTVTDAAKVRVVMNVQGNVAAATVGNPLKGLGIGRAEMPQDRKDGSFDLIGGYGGNSVSSPISGADTVISWKIEASRE